MLYKPILLCAVLYGHETWCLTLRREHGLKVFENRVLTMRNIFGPQEKDVKGSWRKVHNEELHNLFSLPNIIMVANSWRIGDWTMQHMWRS
jgi:hypothetical protein